MEIKITHSDSLKTKPRYGEEALPFGTVMTDHMFLINYSGSKGWHDARIVPYAPLSLDPATNCLHYGQLIFEGMKAYKNPEGKVLMFRPYENAKRMNKSAIRMSMPEIDHDIVVNGISKLLELDKDWIPTLPGMSMYIRPFMMSTDPTINVVQCDTYMFLVILSPVGHIYQGLKPIRIVAETEYIRASRGGTGAAKCAGNYAGGFRAMFNAKKRGFDQVLWLDGISNKYIEEASTMNVFFVIDDVVVTPEITDSILDGITRRSVIEIIKDLGIKVEERKLSIDEVASANSSGKVKEVFCSGTAAVITPIGEITWGEQTMSFNNKETGSLTKKICDELTGIQTGILPDKRGWTYTVC